MEKFKEDLAVHIRFRDGGVHHDGSECDHLKGIRTNVVGVTTMESKRKYLDAVLELLGLEGATDVPTPCVPAHKEQLVTRDLLGPAEIAVYRQCVGGYSTIRRTEQSRRLTCRFGSMVGEPTAWSMPALRRVARYLKGTRELVNELELDQEVDKLVVKLDCFSDSDWAGSTDQKSQPSGVLFIDGTPF